MQTYSSPVKTGIRKRTFFDLMSLTAGELEGLIQLAEEIKAGKDISKKLQYKTIGLLFSVASTRTRISFQVAARQMGGHAEFLGWNDLQLVNHESLKDTAKVMSRYLDALVIRNYDMNFYGQGRETLEMMASYASVPIINALDDKDHPCQVMADLLTLKEKFGAGFRDKKLVMAWGYSTRFKSPGVPHSMLTAAALLGMRITMAYPRGYELDKTYTDFAAQAAALSGAAIEYSHDLNEACTGANVVYIKNWKSIYLPKEEDAAIRTSIRDQWCLTEKHFAHAHPDAIYMDCLPQIRGEGVSAEVMDGKRSVIYDEAENRLHMQKAILATLL